MSPDKVTELHSLAAATSNSTDAGHESSGETYGALDIEMDMESSDATYGAREIQREFEAYRSVLPFGCELLQKHHSVKVLRTMIREGGAPMPRFLRTDREEGSIAPHHALCSLLLCQEDYQTPQRLKSFWKYHVYPLLVWIVFCGSLYPQLNHPADFIRDQFNRVRHEVPDHVVEPHLLRDAIRNQGLPVPNYFLDPEDHHQFPPHIALLVILQSDAEGPKSRHFTNGFYRFAFSSLALVALLLRVVLEVIGAAGAIWGGAEVVELRHSGNARLWRWISMFVGFVSLFRFVILNIPQKQDEGDILGPAGPWSLPLGARLRAVFEHPFHYFVRALPPPTSRPTKKKN